MIQGNIFVAYNRTLCIKIITVLPLTYSWCYKDGDYVFFRVGVGGGEWTTTDGGGEKMGMKETGKEGFIDWCLCPQLTVINLTVETH